LITLIEETLTHQRGPQSLAQCPESDTVAGIAGDPEDTRRVDGAAHGQCLIRPLTVDGCSETVGFVEVATQAGAALLMIACCRKSEGRGVATTEALADH